jgi:hypothetical protein
VNTTDVKWAVGELEWSTLMIVLDKAVRSTFCFLQKQMFRFFVQGYHTGYIYREPLIRFIDKQ